MTTQIGLALSGGGAKGIAHIGVLKVLEEARIPVHMVAGTSMGGVVAAVYAAGRSAAEIEQLLCSLRLIDIAQRDRTGLGLLSQGKIASRLREVLGGDLTFDQLKLPLALVAVDLETGEEVVIRDGSVVEGVLATTALPIIFPPLRWNGRWLVDGGMLNPLPFDVVRRMGADRVIAVHTLHALSDILETEPPPGGHGAEAIIRLLLYRSRWTPLLNVSERSMSIMSRKLIEQRMRESPPDLMLEVPLKGVGLFDLDQMDVCLRAGEEIARQHLSELIGLRDIPLPSRWARWWWALRQRLPG
ncbi:MAG: patatin-like phospholipase family protein [Anaerolineae bacterium]